MKSRIKTTVAQPKAGAKNSVESQRTKSLSGQGSAGAGSSLGTEAVAKRNSATVINSGKGVGGTAAEYQPHTINKMLPSMCVEDYRRLKEGIELNGLKNPILLHEGAILDGWHRYRICMDLGVTPRFENYEGESPLTECWTLNIARRQLKKTQLAALAVMMMPKLETEAKARQLAGLKQYQNRVAKSTATDMDAIDEALPETARGSVRSQVSRLVGVSETYIQHAKRIKKSDPALFDRFRQGRVSLRNAKGELYRAEEAAKKDIHGIVIRKNDPRCSIHNCDILAAPIEDGSLDAIITDPPYPRENLDCWSKLGTFAARKLKEGGILLAMGGAYYLPEMTRNLTVEGLNYYWTLAYHMTELGSLPHCRRLRCNWKPILWYVKGKYSGTFQPTDHLADTVTNCDEGKTYHKWGQSLPFFTTLVERFTYADALVCDPFLGGGTTAIATLSLKRRFIGVELDPKAYQVSTKRIHDWESGLVTVDMAEDDKPKNAATTANPEISLAA